MTFITARQFRTLTNDGDDDLFDGVAGRSDAADSLGDDVRGCMPFIVSIDAIDAAHASTRWRKPKARRHFHIIFTAIAARREEIFSMPLISIRKHARFPPRRPPRALRGDDA